MTTCPICKRELKQLHGSHLKQHNITSEEFKAMYPGVSLTNPSTKRFQNKKKARSEQKYAENPLRCTQCSTPIPYKKSTEKRTDSKNQRSKNKPGNIFCSRSCTATYNNTHKTYGCKKSKLEFYLEEKLTSLYPTLEFHFNRKDAIGSELDIYIPLLKLAFEINGIFHYEPIHGAKKLLETQTNDHKKFQACLDKGIEMCTINSAKLAYFKESNAEPYLKLAREVIDQNIHSKGIDLLKLPVVVYEDKLKLTNPSLRHCKHCNNTFMYSSVPKQVFCTRECRNRYKRINCCAYKDMIANKEKIIKGLSEGLSIISIGKSIGFDNCVGGYYYMLKNVIEEIKKESARDRT
jgi:hypothetical protein